MRSYGLPAFKDSTVQSRQFQMCFWLFRNSAPNPYQSEYRQISSRCRPQRSPYRGEARSSPARASRASARKLATSAGVGGRPVRSRCRRRASVAGSAGPAGDTPRRVHSAARKWSIGWTPFGTAACFGGSNAQCRAAASFSSAGTTAPSSIQRRINSMSASPNGPVGGIASTPFSPVSAWTSLLSADFLATTTGPSRLPFSTRLPRSSLRPAFCLTGPWHDTQCFSKSGRTCLA